MTREEIKTYLGSFVPKLTLREQYEIPHGFRGCCHLCEPALLFLTIDEMIEHVRSNHQLTRLKSK